MLWIWLGNSFPKIINNNEGGTATAASPNDIMAF
jgi:hypothetical protein